MISVYFTIVCYIGLSMASERAMFKKYVDLLPEEIILKELAFTNASKHWNNYVKKLIQYSTERIFPKNILRKESIAIYLQYSVQLFKQFLIKSKQVYDLHFNPVISKHYVIYEITLLQPLMTCRLNNHNHLTIIPSDMYLPKMEHRTKTIFCS